MGLRGDIQELINMASRENVSNTPDYILAGYLITCLEAFEAATVLRDEHRNEQYKEMDPL